VLNITNVELLKFEFGKHYHYLTSTIAGSDQEVH